MISLYYDYFWGSDRRSRSADEADEPPASDPHSEKIAKQPRAPRVVGADGIPIDYDEKRELHLARLRRGSPNGWRGHLVDGPNGWLSKRMHALLLATAETAAEDPCLEGCSVMEAAATGNPEDYRGIRRCCRGIAGLLEEGKQPSCELLVERLRNSPSARAFFEGGGRPEKVLDAVLTLAQISVDNGEFDAAHWSLPVSPFDVDYDLVRVMCMDRACFLVEKEEETSVVGSPRSVAHALYPDFY